MLLGLNHSATPALVDWIGHHIATAGSNQAAVIELLFGKGTRDANAWARRMLKSMKKPSGASRVLHLAAL